MDNFDDEIIDLEDEELSEEIPVEETPSEQPRELQIPSFVNDRHNKTQKQNVNQRYNINPKQRLNNNKQASEKLRNLGTRNRSFPSLGTSNFSKGITNTAEKAVEQGAKEVAKDVTAATGKAIAKTTTKVAASAATKGAAAAATAAGAPVLLIVLVIAAIVAAVVLILIVVFGAATAPSPVQNRTMNNYVIDENDDNTVSEEQLIEQLIYYGYCRDKENCEEKGVLELLNKIKEVYKDYQKDCPLVMTGSRLKNSGDNPCGVKINTALLIEALDYYSATENTYYNYDQEEEPTEEKNPILALFGKLFKKAKDYQREKQDLQDIKDLANAQAEYVKETCRYKSAEEKERDLKDKRVDNKEDQYTQYFYQISYDKFVSYLRYGNTSGHENYKQEPVEVKNEICLGQQDDVLSTSYIQNDDYNSPYDNNSSNIPDATNPSNTQVITNGTGSDVVSYAMQFVGNPYVWGGTSLTNGADCSGFTQQIFAHFGISLPHQSTSQASAGGTSIGTNLANAQPGDLLVWDGHVGIYAGNGQMVHAQSKRTGIVVTPVQSSHAFVGIYRFF